MIAWRRPSTPIGSRTTSPLPYFHGASTRAVDELFAALRVSSVISPSVVSPICAQFHPFFLSFPQPTLHHFLFPYFYFHSTYLHFPYHHQFTSIVLSISTLFTSIYHPYILLIYFLYSYNHFFFSYFLLYLLSLFLFFFLLFISYHHTFLFSSIYLFFHFSFPPSLPFPLLPLPSFHYPQIPPSQADLTMWDGEGHLLPFAHLSEILQRLLI